MLRKEIENKVQLEKGLKNKQKSKEYGSSLIYKLIKI
jgi:hypothetical protein